MFIDWRCIKYRWVSGQLSVDSQVTYWLCVNQVMTNITSVDMSVEAPYKVYDLHLLFSIPHAKRLSRGVLLWLILWGSFTQLLIQCIWFISYVFSFFQIFVIPAMFAASLLHQNSKAISATHRFIAEVYGVSFILVFLISTVFHAVCLTGNTG